ncbi:MCE family protein [Mycolicibacterium alvei]|uniref:Virulence factor n=1 Tax=Mycolicibacterium alvei TaxID=67081 RepID=A0A6N4UV55_9MYCO|nr:MCE family protein [Mycolicibacterium alvei]MCV7003944.1 MCE family protein [Mycolicibacterium alvei]BBX27703.1 virulence factor [Mycolicibacterium alvei]
MEPRPGERRLHPGWWTLIMLVTVVSMVFLIAALFTRSFNSAVPVTLTADRAGLVMESGSKVKMRGIQVGRVRTIDNGGDDFSLQLDIFPGQIKYIPANVGAQIQATTAFGAKFVELVYPADPSSQRLAAGAVIRSSNVSTEVNTVFQSLVDVIHQIDPSKLNAVLTAIGDAVRGKGERMGHAITDADQVLHSLNPRAETSRRDWKSLKGFADTYDAAADDIVTVLDAATTIGTSVVDNARALDSLLLNLAGFSASGINLLAPVTQSLVDAVDVTAPTTDLLLKYHPSFTCMLLGGKHFLDDGGYEMAGGNGKSLVVDSTLMLGDDPYRFPDNLPITGAKGGPGGKPGCGSLPVVSENWPQRQLITDTGWGTGLDLRPNPGIGFPGWANYFPVTRGVPEPPSLRNQGGPAPGPVPYPGAPPYGAQLYAPDGTPLYPGLPAAPPPGQPREPEPPPPGSEPFVTPVPAQLGPTLLPPPP